MDILVILVSMYLIKVLLFLLIVLSIGAFIMRNFANLLKFIFIVAANLFSVFCATLVTLVSLTGVSVFGVTFVTSAMITKSLYIAIFTTVFVMGGMVAYNVWKNRNYISASRTRY